MTSTSSKPLSNPQSPSDADLESGRRVLRVEADAIGVMADQLDHAFSDAVTTLANVSGRCIITGMGKSGHIARKIAATLASTGTPAYFVHPGEASHGDMGMITDADAVIALSNSGETPELSDLVAYTRRFKIPLVAITKSNDSTLAKAADVALCLPNSPEACPMGLAPTTSTTATLALGDALAVALLERKGFSATDFRALHPGGQLGHKLSRVADIMHTGDAVPLLPTGASMSAALIEMTAKRFGCVGIVDAGGALAGIITDGDLRRHMNAALTQMSVDEVMTSAPKTIRPDALVEEAVHTMNSAGATITNLFVLEDGKPVGVLHIHDCLRAGRG